MLNADIEEKSHEAKQNIFGSVCYPPNATTSDHTSVI